MLTSIKVEEKILYLGILQANCLLVTQLPCLISFIRRTRVQIPQFHFCNYRIIYKFVHTIYKTILEKNELF